MAGQVATCVVLLEGEKFLVRLMQGMDGDRPDCVYCLLISMDNSDRALSTWIIERAMKEPQKLVEVAFDLLKADRVRRADLALLASDQQIDVAKLPAGFLDAMATAISNEMGVHHT